MHRKRILLFLTFPFLCVPTFSNDDKAPVGIMKESKALQARLKELPYKIAYETYANNNWELFAMNADGSDPINLTNTPDSHEMYPHVSSDGKKICFVSDEAQNGKKVRCVYFMNIDGSGRVKVDDHARQPCWSPDGKTIAYLKCKYSRFQINDYATKEIWFYDWETKERKIHPNKDIHHLYNLCWVKIGRWFVATVHAGMGYSHSNLAIEVDGTRVYDLGIDGCRPDVSPDGKRIVWGRTDHIISIADIDFDAAIPKVSAIWDVVVDELHVYHVDWSPDGNYISYSRGPGGEIPESGPGTNRGIAELVGVKGIWDICVTPVDSDREYVDLTARKQTCKESEWFVPLQ